MLTRLGDDIADVAGAVHAVFEVDLGLARALDADGEGAGAGLAGPHVKLARTALFAALQARAAGVYTVGAAVLCRRRSPGSKVTRNSSQSVTIRSGQTAHRWSAHCTGHNS